MMTVITIVNDEGNDGAIRDVILWWYDVVMAVVL